MTAPGAAPPDDVSLGFSGMLLAGVAPAEAYEQIRRECAIPEIREVLDRLQRSPEGRAALEASRQSWASYGFPPPWQEPAKPADRGRL